MKILFETQIKIIYFLLAVAILIGFISLVFYNIHAYLIYKIYLELRKNGVNEHQQCMINCLGYIVNKDTIPFFNLTV